MITSADFFPRRLEQLEREGDPVALLNFVIAAMNANHGVVAFRIIGGKLIIQMQPMIPSAVESYLLVNLERVYDR